MSKKKQIEWTKEEIRNDVIRIIDFLKERTIGQIASYDIKDEFIDKNGKNKLVECAVNKMRNKFDKNYDIGELNSLKKTCCYKIANGDLKIDCDASLFCNVIYKFLFKDILNNPTLEKKGNNIFVLKSDGNIYRGDTMNSYATTVRMHLRNVYPNDDIYDKDPKTNEIRRAEKTGNPYLLDKYYKVSNSNGWDVCILDKYNYMKQEILSHIEAIEKFTNVWDTIGNMILVPINLNSPRANKTKANDYWDLTLRAIKENKFEDITYDSFIEECEEWYNKFKSNDKDHWKNFIEKTFMTSFVDKNSEPLELCQKENKKPVKPVYNSEYNGYEEFYNNASACIMVRGLKMAAKLKEIVKDKDPDTIINEYFPELN